jgi:hypothetical protein
MVAMLKILDLFHGNLDDVLKNTKEELQQEVNSNLEYLRLGLE